jgi:hypothetical protein
LKTLPNTVRSLPYTVRSPRQRSTRLSYQGTKVPTQKDNQFWTQFQEYLKRAGTEHTAKVRLSYARKYLSVLSEGDAKELLMFSNDKRTHVMKSLASLSKFIGCYDVWKEIIDRHQLKWATGGVEVFNNILNSNGDNYSSNTKGNLVSCL